MFHPKHHNTLFAFFMALLMSGLMSLVITLFNLGAAPELLSIWLRAWAFAFSIAFPSILILAPLVRKLVGKLIRHPA